MKEEDQILAQLEEDLRNFTDRDEALGLVRRRVDAPAGTPLPMLMFYGVGGAGKSVLATKLCQVFHQELPSAFVDFDTGTGSNPFTREPASTTLLEIARQLKAICPRFELGCAALLQRLNQTPQMRPGEKEESDAEDVIEEGVSGALEGAAELAEVTPFGIGFVVKLLRMGWDRAHLPERQKIYKAFQRTPAGQQLISELRVAGANRIAAHLVGLLGEDLAERLPMRAGKACRALIVLDTIEHLRRTGQAGLQQFTDRERWIFELWKTLHAPGPTAAPFAQIVLLGRDQLKHWCDNSTEINVLHALEQHPLGGFPENEAKEFLRKKGVSSPVMQEAILHSAEDVEAGPGPKKYHALSLGLLADTVAAEELAGREPSPATLTLTPGNLDLLAMRFLQSMSSPTEERRIVRLARTPRFDDKALERICSPDPDANVEERKRIRGYTFIQETTRAGWLVVHPRVRDAILSLPKYSERDEVEEQHHDWETLWRNRSQGPTDDFAGLAWFHSLQLDWTGATKAWQELAAKARAESRMQAHQQLMDWWMLTGVETSKHLEKSQAPALAMLAREILAVAMNLPACELSRATACLTRALTVIALDKYPKMWAQLQANLGAALSLQGGRTGGAEGAKLLEEGVRAFREALKALAQSTDREQWANVQHNLGNALTVQAERCPSAITKELLTQAELAFQAALTVFTEQSAPSDWATLQNNLANTTRDHGLRVAGPDCARLLAAAESAHRAALRVRTPDKTPAQWAVVQNNLGIVLMERGIRAAGPDSVRCLDEAVTVCREALRVASELGLPQQRGMAQDNLANALREKGWRRAGRGGVPLLSEAVAAYRAALSVYTESEFPPQWATVQSDLASALLLQGCLAAQGAGLIGEAQAALTQALRVFTREDFPLDWAMAHHSLGEMDRELAIRQPPDRREGLLKDAIAAYRLAGEVRTRETLPQQWAGTQNNLAIALRELALLPAPADASSLFEDAIHAHEEALTVFTRTDLPQPWAFTIDSLGVTFREQGAHLPSAQAPDRFAQAIAAHRSALEVFTLDEFPYPWALAHKNLADALRQWSAVSPEPDKTRLATEAAAEYRQVANLLNSEETPFDYRATQEALALVEAMLPLPGAGGRP